MADPDSFEKLGEWLKTLQETAEDSLKCIMVVENKADQLPEGQQQSSTSVTRRQPPQRPSSFVQEEKVQAFCQEHGLLFARTSAKMNASAAKWGAHKVGDVVSHLLLSIHAATLLARGLGQGVNATTGNTGSGQGQANNAGADGKVVLTAISPRGTDAGPFAENCSSCGKN